MFAILLICLFLSSSFGCDSDADCLPVSENYNYVKCVDHVCRCDTEHGFSGLATTSDKCTCNYNIKWEMGVVYCTSLANGVTYQLLEQKYETMKNKIRQLYEYIKWPTAAGIAWQVLTNNLNGGMFDLFAIDAKGRVDPAGEFHTRNGCVEYFVGSVWTGRVRVWKNVFQTLVAEGNEVVVNVDIHFNNYANTTSNVPIYTYNLTQTGRFLFNDNLEIQSLDLVIRNVYKTVLPVNPPTPETMAVVCYTLVNVAKCNSTHDPDGYFTDMNDCLSFMSTKQFGTWDDIRADTIYCRQYHSALAVLDPFTHCPHGGKTGGGKCTPHTSQQYYLESY